MRKKIRRFVKKLTKRLAFTKREKFALIVAILTFDLLIIQLVTPTFRYPLTAGLVVLTYILSAWGLREDLGGVEWLTLFILPTMYAGVLTLFYFLLPVRWLTRLPTIIIFAMGMYAILLLENIYNVAARRSIQLLRAAHSVGLVLTLLTAFLLFAIIFSLHLPFFWNVLLIFIGSFPLVLQSLWAMKLEQKISQETFLFTLIVSLILSELVFILSFWPIQTIIGALFLTTVFYSLAGMIQQHLMERLFWRTMVEFMAVSIVVFILILLTTRWGGGR